MIVAVFWDRSALVLDKDLLARKQREVVLPYLESKKAAIAEIRGFTGETPETIEDIAARTVTYDFARLTDDAIEVKTSAFGDAIIDHM
ncbi:MAG: hypothetical protein V3S26_00355, partial [Acidimicrobiia bacterium]